MSLFYINLVYMSTMASKKDEEDKIMQVYKNLGGDSNVKGFVIGEEYIDVQFYGTAKVYRYSYRSAGREKVEEMKKLAKIGKGLNSYIMRYARFDYEK